MYIVVIVMHKSLADTQVLYFRYDAAGARATCIMQLAAISSSNAVFDRICLDIVLCGGF